MFHDVSIFAIALCYVTALFGVAWAGDRYVSKDQWARTTPMIYPLSLAVYCTSWTFFGSVGLSATTGYSFIPVYIGPILMMTLGLPLMMRIVRIAKSQNVTSVSDFIASRYGKSSALGAVVTVIAVIGTLPYIALQLKAIAISFTIVTGTPETVATSSSGAHSSTALLITMGLFAFAVLFGTRHVDASEHQRGLMLAIATESVVKLAAFICVGLFVVFSFFGSFGNLRERALANPDVAAVFAQQFDGGLWLTVAFLSFLAMILLPRQFHVAVVENDNPKELRRAAWVLPIYLIAINLLVVPIAAAGLLVASPSADPDFYMLLLPLDSGSHLMTVIAFLGGLSAATAMVIVETVALSIMISNGILIPLMLNDKVRQFLPQADISDILIWVRRGAIFVILSLAYLVFLALGETKGLAAIGLVSFAAIAQLAPAFFGGLIWRNATRNGALAGMAAGFAVWAYTLLLPWVATAGWVSEGLVDAGPWGLEFLKPQSLMYLSFHPLTHGVLWSLGINILVYIVVSLLRAPEPIERLQAAVFVQEGGAPRTGTATALRLWRTAVTVGDLQRATARYLGQDRAERAFAGYARSRSQRLNPISEADLQLIRFTEHLLTSSIGAASARLVLALLLRRGNVSGQSALKLLDDASEALQYNRDLLQSAIDQVGSGLSVFNSDMRLICWNRQFREIFMLPADVGQVGAPLDQILRALAERGDFGEGEIDDLVAERLMKLAVNKETFQERFGQNGRIIEISTSAMPQGGIVTTYTDITERVEAEDALARANETLERRVRERTAELMEVNAALAVAKSKADTASMEKTRFLAAASHDILQPLNAARLYATSLKERTLPETEAKLARNVDASLLAVEEIFSTLIDISRMDSGRLEAKITDFPIREILDQLRVEYQPLAQERDLKMVVMPSNYWVRSDRRLLRRMLQNLLSNAIKYTPSGGVLLGVRPRGSFLVLQVLDTGPGIPPEKQAAIFKEFQRLETTASEVSGLGLGLSIVERVGRLLEHDIGLNSEMGKGSTFSVIVPRGVAQETPEKVQAPVRSVGSLSGLKVLCIDNEPAVLAGMSTLLDGWGCHVLTAANLNLAVKAVADGPIIPDIILADYHLDEGLGPEAIEAVRAFLKVDIPAIIITADHTAEGENDIRGRGLGMLRKPVRAAALRALMTNAIQQSRAAAE
ncbi:MAG: PAS domain-containing hybrid sensor histidine kinase/response regulator [Pseudomonadota bacterium]